MTTAVQQPIDRSKDAVARRLAQSHYRVDPAVTRIVRLVSPSDENSPNEPVKLLEVNEETFSSGIVPVYFGPHVPSGVFFPSVIVEVRPEEYEQIVSGELPLPSGWTLGEEYSRTGDES